ncbi:NAD+ synthase [Burkholderia vietnamiensis]|uniref:Glutamine-dependent NAD(+) synthetase n=1 Tax=Burkholderia vietnamiensis (strain G4 / LMG 22486) TaxID=269482 RepID=A4JGU5_BURVG|nr:NAD+ synthase [Burkholderia vietnamiensis]ABO55498.1 DNA-directed RNA polymerase, subunit H [Burkholderia vietnamiensis G4]AOK41609.1 NAD synthetase [Burkholderia vietnamiensis]KVF38999.1 NAD synthetase [Burkholderia vietnamiensis]MBR8206433.1 NAD+ synthase [Burkholderia vietnamiensis]MCA8395221.1 NAD+ synthase [Burkholderia vietnamiensis]
MKTRLALAQINVTVGDFAGNVARIVAAARAAHDDGAHLMIAPELALSGYPPEDLLLRPAFYTAAAAALDALADALREFNGLAVLVGHPLRSAAGEAAGGEPAVDGNANRPIERGVPPVDTYNAASLIVGGKIVGTYRKQDLPNADVFDEKRYFATDTEPLVFELNGVKYGVIICEDAWHASAAQIAKAAGAQVLLIPNGSPYHMNKEALRIDILRARIRETGLPMVYVNLVGGQDELVFDGGSFVLDGDGVLVAKMPLFDEGHAIVEFDGARPLPGAIAPELPVDAQVYRALVTGVRDYIGKNGFPGVLIGLSGGVDSALVLAVACDALGPERVRAVMMPSRYTADISTTDAAEMARRVGVRYDEIAIAPMFDAFRAALAGEFAGRAEDATEENIQARIRGTLLMALSNKFGSIVLTTGNKSEMAVGYCTLYGDMAGGFAVIKDIAKTQVYQLCRYRNATPDYGTRDVIPERILTRAPSAELRENQTDQDSLPPYDVLDAIMRMYMEEDRPLGEIVAAGYAEADVARVTRLIKINEYKRRQAPIGIRVTHRAFGRDWRYPITSRFTERVD